MNNIRKQILLLMGLTLVATTSCNDAWDSEDVTGTKSQTLWEVISSKPELSEFKSLLETQYLISNPDETYSQLLSSAGTFTVFAPNDDVIKLVPDSLKSDIPASHIAEYEYNKAALDAMQGDSETAATFGDSLYLTMYNGKSIDMKTMNLETTEYICRNGILRISLNLNKRSNNIYETLVSLAPTNDMAAFIVSLGDSVMDMDKSIQTSVDDENRPIYDTVLKYTNPLLDYIALDKEVANRESRFVFLLLDNASFQRLSSKYFPYMKQHNGSNRSPIYSTTNKPEMRVDSAKTDSVSKSEVVLDMVGYVKGMNQKSFTSFRDIVVDLDAATISDTISTSNGVIYMTSGANIRLKDNKIKDIYVQGEDYYETNENYVFVRRIDSYTGTNGVTLPVMGGRDVVLCGADTLRMRPFWTTKDSLGTDSVIYTVPTLSLKSSTTNYFYYSGSSTQRNLATGGSYLAYKAPLFSCQYKIYWRSFDDRSHHVKPDTTDVDYAKYVENTNIPVYGVIRNYQKLYISQAGNDPLKYNSSASTGDFVQNFEYTCSYGVYSSTGNSRCGCMVGYDVNATDDELSASNRFQRLGINAGFLENETPLIWCKTAKVDQSSVYYSGVIAPREYKASDTLAYATNGMIRSLPRDIFYSYFNGDATVFVTNSVFNQTNTTRPTSSSSQPHGSIYLDYIHFVPVIDE